MAGTTSAVLAALVLCVGCGAADEPGSAPPESSTPSPSATPTASASEPSGSTNSSVTLTVQLFPDGSTAGSQYSLGCAAAEPIGESQAPDPQAACQTIHEHPQILTPQRGGNRMCTEIYGGPSKAIVSGTLNGKEFSTEFTRNNGCYIDEWDTLASLLGQGSDLPIN